MIEMIPPAMQPLAEIESVLGKAHTALTDDHFKVWVWQFTSHTLNQTEYNNIALWQDDEHGFRKLKCITGILNERGAWNFRWHWLKETVGIK